MNNPPVECINTYDQLIAAGKAGVPCTFAITLGRPRTGGPVSKWLVYSPFLKTDSKGTAWYNNGQKAFSMMVAPGHDRAAQKQAALVHAQEWVKTTYGFAVVWVRNQMGDYLPKEIHERFPLKKQARRASKPKDQSKISS